MSVDDDGVEQTFEGGLRVAVTVAASIGAQLARLREEHAERARAQSEQAARDFAARMDAERTLALGRLEVVKEPKFWDRAGVADIANAHTDARAWSEHDPKAGAAMHRIRDEVLQRYGVDVHAPAADPAAVSESLARAIAERQGVEASRTSALERINATKDPKWWDRANSAAITTAYSDARALADTDKGAAAAVNRIRDEAQRRYGVDLQDVERDPVKAGLELGVAVSRRQEIDARAHVEQTKDAKWWDSAGTYEVARAYTGAVRLAGAEQEPGPADREVERIRVEVRDRYGVDVRDFGGDPAAVQDALARAEAARKEAAAERGGAREGEAEAAVVMGQADRADRAAEAARERARAGNGADVDDTGTPGPQSEHATEPDPGARAEGTTPEAHEARADGLRQDSGVAYDSAERRDAMAAKLEGKVDAETLNARVAADRNQGTHPLAAVQKDPYKVARTSKKPPRGSQRQRTGLER